MPNVQVGDWIVKTQGRGKNRHGLVVSVKKNPAGNTLIEVLVDGEHTVWPEEYVYILERGANNERN